MRDDRGSGRAPRAQWARTTCPSALPMTAPTRLLTLLALAVGMAALSWSQPSDTTHSERDFLTRVWRLTVAGKRAGEGYWSPDGKRMVFQSEREPDNPFYQIYVFDLERGEV